MQFVEGLTDRQAADAVRARLDWKYALSLELTDSGFDFSVLSGAGEAPPPVSFGLASLKAVRSNSYWNKCSVFSKKKDC